MDSEHRHELKSNELADLLTHFPEFLKRNAYTIIGITLIVIALITWPLFSKMKSEKTIAEEAQVASAIQMLSNDINNALQAYQASPEQLNVSLNAVLANADALMDETDETDNPNLAALAYIKAAQAIRTELHLRKEVVSPDTVATQIQKAVEAYEQADQTAAIPMLKAMAQFGLGLCAEEDGRPADARAIYETIAGDETFAATHFPVLARQRLETMQDIGSTFSFVEAPETEPAVPDAVPMSEIRIPEGQPAPEISIPAQPVTPAQPAEPQPETPAVDGTPTPDAQPEATPAEPQPPVSNEN